MELEIRFKGYLNFEDSLKIQSAVTPRRRLPAAVLVTVLVLGTVAVMLSRMPIDMIPAFLLLAFLGTFMAVGYRLMSASARKTQRALYEQACIKRNGVLKTDGIHIKRGRDRQIIPWRGFDRALEIEGVVAVVKNGNFLGFARYMFNTEGEWTRARDMIMNQYG